MSSRSAQHASWNASTVLQTSTPKKSTPRRRLTHSSHPDHVLSHSSSVQKQDLASAAPGGTSLSLSLLLRHSGGAMWSCWMCDAPCLEGGWEGMLPQLRPVTSSSTSLPTTSPSGGELSQLTLCRRCNRAISSPPGSKLLDVIHQCNSTFASRNRSYTFVAFLREYKLLLELIGMEDSDAHHLSATAALVTAAHTPMKPVVLSPRAKITPPLLSLSSSSLTTASLERGVEAFTQLLQCIESTLQEESSLRDAHREQQHHQSFVTRSDTNHNTAQKLPRVAPTRGAEWLLRPTERELLETEARQHKKTLLWLSKRISLIRMDSERTTNGGDSSYYHMDHRHNRLSVSDHHRQLQQQEREAKLLSFAPPPEEELPLHHQPRDDHEALLRSNHQRRHFAHHHKETTLHDEEEELPQQPAGNVKDMLRGYFSGELTSLPREAFEQYLSSSPPKRMRQQHQRQSHSDSFQDSHNDHHIDPYSNIAVEEKHIADDEAVHSHVVSHDQSRGDDDLHKQLREEQHQHHASVLRSIEAEMTNVRREHDRQRHDWGEERSGLLNELNTLREKINELETSSISEQRRHRRSISEQTSMAEDATRATQASMMLSAKFGNWIQAALQRSADVQRVKSDLFAVEASAVVQSVVLDFQSLTRRVQTLEAEKKESARFEKLLAEARAEVVRSAAAVVPLSSPRPVVSPSQQRTIQPHSHNVVGTQQQHTSSQKATHEENNDGVSYF